MRWLIVVALLGCGKKADKPQARSETSAAQPGSDQGSGAGGSDPGSAVAAKTHTTPDAKAKRFGECIEAFNAAKYDVFRGCYAADAVREQVDSVPELMASGPDSIVEMAKAQRAAFPDLRVTPQLVLVNGSEIVAILHVGGTNTVEANGMKATGKQLGVFEAEVAVMGDDGTLSRDSFYVDQPTIFHQLDLLPNDSSPAPIAVPKVAGATHASKGTAQETANKALIEKQIAAVAKKDTKTIADLAADDVKFTYHGEKTKYDTKKAYLKWFEETFKSTKDSKITTQGMWAAEDYVAVSDLFQGTPADKAVEGTVETHVVQLFRIVDGKIKQHDMFVNRLKTAVQLGMVDPDELMQALADASKKK